MSQTLTIIVLSTYRWNTSRCIFNPGCAIAIFFVQLYTSSIPLRLGNNLPVANFHRWAAITGFSREVPHEGVTAQLIRLPGVTHAHCVLAHNRLRQIHGSEHYYQSETFATSPGIFAVGE